MSRMRPSSARLLALAARVLERYSFSFALVLTIGLLIATLVSESGGFGLTDQLANLAPIALAGMASTPAIISGGGGFDVSISPLMTLASAVFVAVLVPHGLGGAESVPIILGMCAAVGALDGFVIVALRIPPVVATLAMYFFLLGLNLQIVPQPETLGESWVSHLAHSVGPIPGALFTIGLPLAIWGALGLVPYRRTLLAAGNNDAAAFASGANVALIRISAYALGGFVAGIGGFALTALVSSVTASLASAYTLLAVASVALGGTSLWGGRGGMFGAVLGAAAIYLLENLLAIAQVDPSWLQVMYGGMLLVAVVISGVGSRAQEV